VAKGSDGRVSDVQELVPLRTDFDVVLRGYRRGQVRAYVHAVEEELRLAAADRDANAELAAALAAEVEQLRAQNARLTRHVDEMSRSPLEPAAVPPRLRRMVELAKEEAAEITARAQAAAEHSWATAEEAAGRLRARYADALTEMDRTRREMEIEHRTLLQQARADATVMTTSADRRRAELDQQAARRREQVESDFEVAMAGRRAEAMREVAEQKVAAQKEADRLVREATEDARRRVATAEEEATRRITEAEREVDRLRELRGRMAARLRGAREVLSGAGPLLQPLPAEEEIEPPRRAEIPKQRASLVAKVEHSAP
jgi:cell division septum initiation protein DivIVA